MLDIPFAFALVCSILGGAAGATLVFFCMDAKVQRLQADARDCAARLLSTEWDLAVLREHGPRVDLVLDEKTETVEWGDAS